MAPHQQHYDAGPNETSEVTNDRRMLEMNDDRNTRGNWYAQVPKGADGVSNEDMRALAYM